MSLLEWVKAVPTPLAGTTYEPLLQVAVLISAVAWLLTRRHVITVAHWVWPLIQQAAHAFRHASQFPPSLAAERRDTRPVLYSALVYHGSLAVAYLLGGLLAVAVFPFYLAYHLWSFSVFAVLTWFGAWCLARLHLAAAKWAWRSLTTGAAFTWPYHHTP